MNQSTIDFLNSELKRIENNIYSCGCDISQREREIEQYKEKLSTLEEQRDDLKEILGSEYNISH